MEQIYIKSEEKKKDGEGSMIEKYHHCRKGLWKSLELSLF